MGQGNLSFASLGRADGPLSSGDQLTFSGPLHLFSFFTPERRPPPTHRQLRSTVEPPAWYPPPRERTAFSFFPPFTSIFAVSLSLLLSFWFSSFLYYLPISSSFPSFTPFSSFPFLPFLHHSDTSPPVPLYLCPVPTDYIALWISVLLDCSMSSAPPSLIYPCPSVYITTFLGLPAPHTAFLPSNSAGLLLRPSYCFLLD